MIGFHSVFRQAKDGLASPLDLQAPNPGHAVHT